MGRGTSTIYGINEVCREKSDSAKLFITCLIAFQVFTSQTKPKQICLSGGIRPILQTYLQAGYS